MGLCGVGANDQHNITVKNTVYGIRHCSRTKYCDQTGHGWAVSVSGTVVDIICADPGAKEFLEGVIFFDGTSG